MNSPALYTNWQKTAQLDGACLAGACDCFGSCQHAKHAGNISPFSAMVCRNHYPSPSSTRSSALASGSGLFSCSDRGLRWATSRMPRKKRLGNTRYRGKMTVKTNPERGSHTCNTESLSQARSPLQLWQDASGTTFSAPALAQPRVRWSQKPPAATFLPEPSSARAQVRCAMTWASVSATDLNYSGSAQGGSITHNRPAETIRSGGLFYVNLYGTFWRRAFT